MLEASKIARLQVRKYCTNACFSSFIAIARVYLLIITGALCNKGTWTGPHAFLGKRRYVPKNGDIIGKVRSEHAGPG
jgi:hypothetical protein